MARTKNMLTMTLNECVAVLRTYGVKTSGKSVADGIASGAYPFGRIVSTGETGRRRIEIFRVDFLKWLQSKIPEAGIHDAVM